MCLEIAASKLDSWPAEFRNESYEHHAEVCALSNDAITKIGRTLTQGQCDQKHSNVIVATLYI
jgi:hypothetical protein